MRIRSSQVLAVIVCVQALLGYMLWTTPKQVSPFCDLEHPPPRHGVPKRAETCPTTFVTQYFQVPGKHAHSEYVDWVSNLRGKACMLIFTDTPLLWQGDQHAVVIRTSICAEGRALNRSQCFWREQWHLDPEAGMHHSYQLYIAWNLKPYLLAEGVRLNPWSSQSFFWIDAGYMRRPTQGEALGLVPRIPENRDQMVFMLVAPFSRQERAGLYHYTVFEDRIAGNMFGGSAEAVTAWSALYYRVLQEYVNRGWFVGKDQNIMNTLCIAHPRACSLVEPKPGFMENPWFFLWECLMSRRECPQYESRD